MYQMYVCEYVCMYVCMILVTFRSTLTPPLRPTPPPPSTGITTEKDPSCFCSLSPFLVC